MLGDDGVWPCPVVLCIAALLTLGCSCAPADQTEDSGPGALDAACVGGEVCSDEPRFVAIGDEPNREFPYGGASLQIIGDHVLGAAHIAGRRGEGSAGETVVFHQDLATGTFALVDRRPDGFGLVRGGRSASAATLIVPIDSTKALWARRYRVSAAGVVSADTFPIRGSAAPVDLVADDSDLVVDHHIDDTGAPVLSIWEWPDGGTPIIHRVPLADVSGLASPNVANIQAARATDGRLGLVMTLPTSFAVAIVDAGLTRVEAVATLRGATGYSTNRRMFVRWGSGFLLTTEHGVHPEQHSEFWSISSTGEVTQVARLRDGHFVRDMSPGPEGSALIAAARVTDGYEPPALEGGAQREAQTWVLRLDASGCLRGYDEVAFRASTTAFAISPLGAGVAVLGLRNPRVDETKFELALLCASPD